VKQAFSEPLNGWEVLGVAAERVCVINQFPALILG